MKIAHRFTLMLALMLVSATAFAQKKPKKELYVPMDYSTCGYHASEALIPDVKVAAYVEWQEGDCSPVIQQALDYVASLKADANGHRGTVLIGEGVFVLNEPLRISKSGIVLRGMGMGKTILKKKGVDRGALVYLEGKESPSPTAGKGKDNTSQQDTLHVAPNTFTAGTMTLTLAETGGWLKTGDRVCIVRPCTRAWIEHLGMDDFGGGLDYTGWKPSDVDIVWDRTITAVDGANVTFDAPVTTTISAEYGGAFIVKNTSDGEMRECGVENMCLETEVNDWNPKDEDHCWDGIFVENARDCWVRRVEFRHFAGSAVNLQKHTSRITVEDCIAKQPVSEIGGWRRNVFITRGQQCLFQRCLSVNGIHDFAAGFCAAGPNAFVQCDTEESFGFSGSIGSWAAGLLMDIVNIDGNDIRYANLEQFQTGTGWNTANSMMWQCTAATIECYSPDSENRNSAHGSWGCLTGNGEWTSSNDHVKPRSLYYDQLEKRLAAKITDADSLKNFVNSLARLLPRSTDATSSPTVEQAMQLAQESLTQPRLTMAAWIAEIDGANPIPATISKNVWRPKKGKDVARQNVSKYSYKVMDGHIVNDGCVITGNQYSIPWWNGRVKDNYVARDGKPAITRFVPGREGTGWTDRIDSVANYLSEHNFSSLDHNYGLWYDLRRTDHERVRRADGDVWAPFYEQPFSRTGKGTAWDGLSCYDLTKPNKWYWKRLNDFASATADKGIVLFCEHYFQHNILEAGAHWVDCPWRPVNNVNATTFPEPVPFAGDKRIFMAEQFYNTQDDVLKPLHKQYIRMCLQQLSSQQNVVHLLSAEYTGPLHFTRFWLQTIAEWEEETGQHPLIALSCTRDAQDSIMADPALAKVVDIIDIRYWHYNTEGLWAPEAGRNMAPRQWMRKMKVGKTGFQEVYKAVRECRDMYPDKAVTYFSQQYPAFGWAVLMAGGSMPNIPVNGRNADVLQQQLLHDIASMTPQDMDGWLALVSKDKGCLLYSQTSDIAAMVAPGKYNIYQINANNGELSLVGKNVIINGSFAPKDNRQNKIYWLQKR